jgi:hypothetical protein
MALQEENVGEISRYWNIQEIFGHHPTRNGNKSELDN